MIHRGRNIADYLFYVAFGTLVSLTFVANVGQVASAVPALVMISLGILMLAVLLRIREYRGVEAVILCLFGIIAVYRLFCCGDTSTIKFVLLLAACRGVELSRCIRLDMLLRLVWTIVLVVFSQMGLAQDAVIIDAERGVRHSLGFSNANQLGMNVLIISLEMLYLNGFKLKVATGLLLLGIVSILDFFSGSRSATLLIYIAIAVALVNTFWRHGITRSNVLFRASQFAAPMLFMLTMIALVGYQKGDLWALEINEILTNRIKIIDFFSAQYDLSLFGRDIAVSGVSFDVLYAYLFFGYGLLICVGYLAALPLLIQRLHARHEHGLVIVFLLLSIYGLSERLWLCVEYNAFMLAFSLLLYGDNSTYSERAVAPCSKKGADSLSDTITCSS